MRAAVIREHGGPEMVQLERVPRPTIEAAGEVIVRVEACALNRLDLFLRKGLSGPGVRPIHLPAISGVDVAGDIAEVGSGVSGWRPGDRVVLYPSLSCGRCDACRAGEESMCAHYRIFGEDVSGGLAEYCRVPAGNLEALPEHLSYLEAAAVPVAYTTAWRMLTVADVRPQDRVLVLGASGGVGSAAVVLARRCGAYVFAVTGGEEKVERLRAVGANRPIDREQEDFEAVVAAETEGRGVDVAVNPVGGDSWRPTLRSLAMGGRMAICGATIGDNPAVSIREIYQSHRQILGAPMGNRRDFRAVLDLLLRREITPVVHVALPLERIAEGHRLLEEGRAFGKVVMVIGDDSPTSTTTP